MVLVLLLTHGWISEPVRIDRMNLNGTLLWNLLSIVHPWLQNAVLSHIQYFRDIAQHKKRNLVLGIWLAIRTLFNLDTLHHHHQGSDAINCSLNIGCSKNRQFWNVQYIFLYSLLCLCNIQVHLCRALNSAIDQFIKCSKCPHRSRATKPKRYFMFL